MNPDVVDAIERLRERRILSEAQAAPLSRVYRGELVSVEPELRAALYAGVLLLVMGVGLFLKENHERIGPAAIAVILGAAALACLFYAWRRLPAFSWQSMPSPHVGADYVLLLGVLLAAADLAWIESQFRVLGPDWPYHLLVVSILYFAAAYRFDSRAVLSLALSAFAAWRGVSVSLAFASRAAQATPAVRVNALVCGAIFVGGGIYSVRANRKPHFEPVWTTLGLLLFLGALVSGVFQYSAVDWPWWEVPLWACSGVVIVVSYRLRRTLDFSLGVLAAYLGLLRLLEDALSGTSMLFVVGASSLAVIVLLVRMQRRMKEPA
jgi:hypothetical protein